MDTNNSEATMKTKNLSISPPLKFGIFVTLQRRNHTRDCWKSWVWKRDKAIEVSLFFGKIGPPGIWCRNQNELILNRLCLQRWEIFIGHQLQRIKRTCIYIQNRFLTKIRQKQVRLPQFSESEASNGGLKFNQFLSFSPPKFRKLLFKF